MRAKFISETEVDTNLPRSATIGGRLVTGELPGEYLESLGYLPLVESLPDGDPDPGFHWAARYSLDDAESPSAVEESWVQEPDPGPPPAVYSKLKILLAAREAGFLPSLIAMLEADPETKWIWDASNTIEDNELLAAYLPAVAQAVGKTPEEVRAFLDGNCLAD